MSRIAPILAVLALATACKAPVEAPEDLGQLALFMFQSYDSDDGEELAVGAVGLDEWMSTLELEGALNDRTVSPPILTAEHLGGITAPAGADPAVQVPIMVAGASRHALAEHVALVGETNRVCIESDTTKFGRRTFVSGEGCFADGSCDAAETANEIRKESALAKVWYDLFQDYRTLELEDGRQVMFSRGWIEESFPADGGDNSWDQLFGFEAWIPDAADPSRTRHVFVLWSSVTLAGVSDDVYANLVKSGIDEGFQNSDDFIDGELCGNDRDRPYDRE